jgi:hypothetical protein
MGVGLFLSAAHRHMLEVESSIAPQVITERGYQTVEVSSVLLAQGFADYQSALVPGLAIPRHWPGTTPRPYQFRPDRPRTRSGRPVKYETLSGAPAMLDVHPSKFTALRDPREELWITEGIKKADALTSRGACAVALAGVWNWRGTNEFGGKTVLPEWDDVALNGRDVLLVFDSDVLSKGSVRLALDRLARWLRLRDAHVEVVCLPEGSNGG